MGFRFRRSLRIAPGVRINVSKSGMSYSFGGRGATVNVSSKGARATYGIPGTGLSYTTKLSGSKKSRKHPAAVAAVADPLPATIHPSSRRFSLSRAVGVAAALILAASIFQQFKSTSAEAPSSPPSPGVTTSYVSLTSQPVAAPSVVVPVTLAQAVEAPAVERAAIAKQYVSGHKVPLRAEPNDKGRVLDRYEAGQAVEVLGRQGDWIQIRHTLTQREGWIQAKRLRNEPPAEEMEAKPAKVSPALGDAAITRLLIERSIADYPGSCACPYQSARNGSSCGKRAAYSRPGGYAPLCYAKDVSPEMIAAYRAEN